MQLLRLAKFAAIGGLVAGGALGVAYAQELEAGAEASTPRRTEQAPAPPKTDLSPQDQLREAGEFLGRADMVGSGVRKQLEEARQRRDVVKSLCLDDKLTQIDVTKRSMSERTENLRQAASRNDAELANHEYTILVVLRDRVDQLAGEANQCIGEESTVVGDTRVTTEIDPTLPTEDPSDYPIVTIVTVPPNCVSCVQ